MTLLTKVRFVLVFLVALAAIPATAGQTSKQIVTTFFDLACSRIQEALASPDLFAPRQTFSEIWTKPFDFAKDGFQS